MEENVIELARAARAKAQGMVEYALIIALVAVVAIGGLVIFGPAIAKLLSRVGFSL